MINISNTYQNTFDPYPNARYSFDTCAFIDTWRRYYPPDVFKSIWNRITSFIEDGTIKATYLVKIEI
ncbi:MAG: DUF4411 family protein [Promethearchaeota archaeon]|nr:MAG: DUF4411 family protein [Candidatus Lokiarchaeota archaeon]